LAGIIAEGEKPSGGFNQAMHSNHHEPSLLIYTSGATLDTVISSPIYLPYAFQIVGVSANVKTAPAGADLVWDVLVDADSIFAAAADRIKIENGDMYGLRTEPSLKHLPARSKLQVQGITLASAGGPIVVIFELARA
jgi:hypothetical protein